jgi:hypothetical protein
VFPLFATSVVDIGGKFAAGVIDTGGAPIPEKIRNAPNAIIRGLGE